MKGVLPLVLWAHHVGTRDFYHSFAALVSPVQNIFFLPVHFFQFMCPHRPATWAGSCAGPPVSECVSPLQSNLERIVRAVKVPLLR
jgi:hypothetical protein